MITITNKNIYVCEFPIYELSSLDKAQVVEITDIINFLSENVELGESVTFKRLFEIVSYNIDKFNEIYYSSLGGYKLDPYLQEIENNTTEVIESEYLEIHWFCDKYETELTISPSIHGINTTTDYSYALDFVSLNNLKDLVVKINKSVELFDYDKFRKSDDKKDFDKTILGDKTFRLFDLYDAIFTEISFHGGPLDKKERLQELEESMTEVEESIKEDKEIGVSFEDMLERMDSEDKYLVKYEEQRDRVDLDRMSSEKNLEKLKNCLKEKLKIYDIIEKSDDNLQQYYKKLTDIEFDMQLLYEEEEDVSFHRFWETPKCTCPKIDNTENFPSEEPIFDKKCPIHK